MLPEGPKSPKIWQSLGLIGTPFSFLRRCYKRYGDRFTVSLRPNNPVVFVSNPQALQVILTSDDAELFDAPGDLLLEPLLGAQSLMALGGDRHRRMRQLLMPPLHGERMRPYGQLIRDITKEVMSECVAEKSFSVRSATRRISIRVILKAVFGLNDGTRYRQLERLLVKMLDGLSSPLNVCLLYFPTLRQDVGPLSPWGRFVRVRKQADELIYDEIAERRKHPDAQRNDILTLLMSARDEAGEALSDAELRDELMTVLASGHETTGQAMAWAFYWIHKFPAVREQLLNELQAIDGSLEPSAVFRLPYLNAVCSETLRIYPISMFTAPRVAKTRVELNGFSVEPGTIVIGCIYLLHRRPDVYPDPDEFRPERFLERRFSPFEYLPFGGGVRRCIGMAFAQFEMKLVISGILSGFELALADSRSLRPARRGLVTGPSSFRMFGKERRPSVLSRNLQN